MRKVAVYIIAIFVSLTLLHVSNSRVLAVESLKVVTFNTQRGSPGWDCEVSQTPRRESKVSPIADYIIKNKIDVILLQEMINFIECPQSPYDETKRLSEILAERGYPMEYAVVPADRQNGMHVPVFSRYPIVRDEVEYIPDDDNWRIYLRVPVQTPLGKIYFYNAHVHHQDSCEGIPIFIRKMRTDNFPLAIGGADFNNSMTGNVCGTNMHDDFNIVVKGNYIDYLIMRKSSPLFFEQSSIDTRPQDPNGINGPPLSDHRPVTAMINTTAPPPTPTPTPTPTPIPLVKSCSVELSATQINANDSVTVQVQATSSRTTDETVGLYFNRYDNGKISPAIPNTTESVFDGRYYYAVTPSPCQTSANNTCNRSIQVFSIPAGTYRVFCDVAQQPNRCSGNPNCQSNGGSIDCAAIGYTSCSDTDMKTVTVSGKTGDVTKDGKVDIFDFNKIIEFFGQDKCEYNVIETCRIDIFDFNQVLTHFGT